MKKTQSLSKQPLAPLTIDKDLAMKDLNHNEDLFYEILDSFQQISADKVIEKVTQSMYYDDYSTGIDFLNGIIASSSFI